MRRTSSRLLSASCIIPLLAACTPDRPTSPRPPAALRAVAGAPLACDFPALRQAARDFFVSNSDPIFQIIRDIELTWQPGGTPAADEKSFDGMQRIAQARGTADQEGTGDDGEDLTKGLIGCTSITTYPADLDSIDVAIDEGVYEVRAGNGDPLGAAIAFEASPGQRVRPDPEWGAETRNWAVTLGQRTLIFGYPRPVSTFTIEPPVTNNGVPFTGFELSSFPTQLTFPPTLPLTAGICIDPVQFGLSRLLHNAQPASAILQLIQLSFCTGSGGAGILALGGVGGSLSGLSPSGAVRVTPPNDVLVFTQQPSDVIVHHPITPAVQVTARTNLGTPVGGVLVRLILTQVGGTIARVDTATTQNDGTATFPNLTVPLPGLYTYTARGALAEQLLQAATSRVFKVRA